MNLANTLLNCSSVFLGLFLVSLSVFIGLFLFSLCFSLLSSSLRQSSAPITRWRMFGDWSGVCLCVCEGSRPFGCNVDVSLSLRWCVCVGLTLVTVSVCSEVNNPKPKAFDDVSCHHCDHLWLATFQSGLMCEEQLDVLHRWRKRGKTPNTAVIITVILRLSVQRKINPESIVRPARCGDTYSLVKSILHTYNTK